MAAIADQTSPSAPVAARRPPMTHLVFADTPLVALCGYRFRTPGEMYAGPPRRDPCVVCYELEEAYLAGRWAP